VQQLAPNAVPISGEIAKNRKTGLDSTTSTTVLNNLRVVNGGRTNMCDAADG
jgi:hypothetical protein